MPTKPPGTPTLDLTDSGDYGEINGAVFMTGQTQSAGTGVFNSFVQIQQNGTEQGYNTDASAQYNEKNSNNHNHSILLAEVPIVIGDGSNGTTEGVVYREFLLDLNEQNGGTKPYISLDKLQIWQEEAGNLTNFTPGAGFAGAHTNYLAYDLDAGGDKWIALDAGMSHGSGQSDYRILIPDSFFINDTAHRYVTLYSKFGVQPGWESGGGFEEWGLHGASGGPANAFNVTKSATVPGGTADTAGEVITYSIKLFNTGNTSLTDITVTDPSVFDLTRGLDQVGNNDNILNAGEIWTYSGHHVVTQSDIDSGAGIEATIDNTVSAGSDQTGHDLAHLDTATSSVAIESRPLAELDKEVSSITSTDEAVGTTSADAAGDVINYIVSVSWAPTGNTTLTSPVVTDPSINVNPIVDLGSPIVNPNARVFVPLFDGDSNLGDNNNNGIEELTDGNGQRDPGETWQYAYIGDTNQDGFHDPGETWTAFNLGDTGNDGIHSVGEIWVGDTNQNGVQEEGEKWQFKNVWDTNNNGLQDGGEVWHYQIAGDDNQNNVEDNGELFQYYNVGDTNQNGIENNGETFQYYNVGDTNQNGDEDNGETFQFNHVLPGLDLNDDNFNDGDINFDGAINAGEIWQFTGSYTVTQDDIDNRVDGVPTVVLGLTHDNTASLETTQGATASDSVSVPIDQNPAYSLVKSVTDVGGDGASGHVDEAGDVISYQIVVSNDGNMTLTGITLDDALLTGPNGTLSVVTESLSANGELDVGETWTFTGAYTAQQSDINNNGGGDGDVDNSATVHSDQLADLSSSTATPIDRNPAYSIVKSVTNVGGDGAAGHVNAAGDVISYQIVVANTGNVDLTGTSVADALLTGPNGTLSAASGDVADFGTLNVGETWTYTGAYTAQQSDIDNNGGGDGDVDNTATVQSDELADQPSSTATPIDRTVDMAFIKAALGYHDANNNDVADAGDTIDFSFTVTNNGNVTLTEIGVADVGGDVMVTGTTIAALAPGGSDSTSWAASYVITPDDVSNGYHDNSAVAIAIEASTPSSVHVILAGLSELP